MAKFINNEKNIYCDENKEEKNENNNNKTMSFI